MPAQDGSLSAAMKEDVSEMAFHFGVVDCKQAKTLTVVDWPKKRKKKAERDTGLVQSPWVIKRFPLQHVGLSPLKRISLLRVLH